ncbi:MAG: UDP-N-acetylmuramate--L-alanine ligase, partial [Patescibacteria group bacterium]
ELYPKGVKKLTVVFQPHLYSRTKAFFTEFTESFDEADRVVFLPIYFAREALDPTVSSEKLAAKVAERGRDSHFYPDFESATRLLRSLSLGSEDVLVTMGAGEAYKVADLLFSREG